MRFASRSSIAVLVAVLACGCRGLAPQLDATPPVRAAIAEDLVLRIDAAARGGRWNDALDLVHRLAASCADPAERAAIGYGGIEARVLAGRAAFLRDAVAPAMFRAMERLLDAKVREQPTPRVPRSFEPGDSLPLPTPASPPDRTGTLAAAREWVARDLFKAMTDRVTAELGVSPDELEFGWKQRRALPTRVVSYGTGTFLVVRRAASAPTPNRSESETTRGGTEWWEGRATGRGRSKENIERPKTGEEWWQMRGPTERREWLTACFVETSGVFDVLRVDQDACTACGGAGRRMADGVAPPIVCWSCNGSGGVRTILYR